MTLATAAIIDNNKVVNTISVDINAAREIQGWTDPLNRTVVVLPDGSLAGIGWDYINNEFYEPLPTEMNVYPGGSLPMTYTVQGDLPPGVTVADGKLTAAADAAIGGTATVTVSDPATSRGNNLVVTVVTQPT